MQENLMKDMLTVIAFNVVTIIQIMALLVVTFGTIQAFIKSLHAMINPSGAGHNFHSGYVQYARGLIVGLTFQLAADIIQTSFAPSWDEIGQLAAIAAIRAFVNFFLERDMEAQERREK
jgi:uncharacterized membrane protein